MKCHSCLSGMMILGTSDNYITNIGGVRIKISNAEISRCNKCSATSVSAKELKRWEQVQHDALLKMGQLPSANEIKEFRNSLGYSVADFALMFGVPRQTVHAWEKGLLKHGSASILINLIRQNTNLVPTLIAMARIRAQEIGESDETSKENTS